MKFMNMVSLGLTVLMTASVQSASAGGGVSPRPVNSGSESSKVCNSGIDGNRDCFEGASSSSGDWHQSNDNRFVPPTQVACPATFKARIVTQSRELLIAGIAVSGHVTSASSSNQIEPVCNYKFNFLKATDKTTGLTSRLQIARLKGDCMHVVIGRQKFAISLDRMWEVPGFTPTELYTVISEEMLSTETVREYSEKMILVPNEI